MHDHCSHCQLKFQREPGFFLGSIYFNYGLTSLISLAVFFTLRLGYRLPSEQMTLPLLAFVLLFPLWFFRYARSLWLGMDQYFDPVPRR